MATEVFNNIGEAEIYSERPNFRRRYDDYSDGNDAPQKTEFTSKPLTEAKKEFLKHLEDDSLTVDKCSTITHDWNKK